jgi:hypothetical protein
MTCQRRKGLVLILWLTDINPLCCLILRMPRTVLHVAGYRCNKDRNLMLCFSAKISILLVPAGQHHLLDSSSDGACF